MKLVKQLVEVIPGGVDQHTEKTQLAPGKLLEAMNVHQPFGPGLLCKRNGYAKLGQSSDALTGTLSNGRGLVSTGDDLVARTKDGIYVQSAGLDKWIRKLAMPPVQTKPADRVMAFGYKPSMCMSADGKFKYFFCGDVGKNLDSQPADAELQVGSGTISGYNRESHWYYRVIDTVSGAEIVRTTALSGVVGWQAKPVAAGGYVWLFVGAESSGASTGRYVYAIKFDPANPTASPVVTTYYDGGVTAGQSINGFDARLTPSGDVVVAIVGRTNAKTGGGTADGVISFLNTATGLPKISPGNVGATIGTITSQACVEWMEDENDPSPTAYYLVVSVEGGAPFANPKVFTIHLTALTVTTTTVLNGIATTPSLIGGYHQSGTGNFVTVSSDPINVSENDHVDKDVHNVAGTAIGVTFTLKHSMSLVSRPFRLTGSSPWYVVTLHDDDLAHLQGTYFLVDVGTGDIHGKALRGNGGDAGQKATFVMSTFNFFSLTRVGPIDANEVSLAVNSWDGEQYVMMEIGWAIDETTQAGFGRLGPMLNAAESREMVIPNSWPIHLAGREVAEYVTLYPRLAPTLVEVGALIADKGLPTGRYLVQFLWSILDTSGDIHRSAPSPQESLVIDLIPDVDKLVYYKRTDSPAPASTIIVTVATIAALPSYTASGGILTATGNAALIADGYSVANNNKLLVKDESDTVRNGIYTVTDAGSPGTPFILTRSATYNQAGQVLTQDVIEVGPNGTQIGTLWSLRSQKTLQVGVDNLVIVNNPRAWQTEVYCTDADEQTPYLQFSVPNEPNSPGTNVLINQDSILHEEALYTFGGIELPNDSPPPFGACAHWRDRVFLFDTDVPGDVWVSKEKEIGIGFSFSVFLFFNISDGAARVRCGSAIDFNSFAIFKEDGIWVISGAGPDKNANGMYQPVRLPGIVGCTNPHSLVTTPYGLQFEAAEDGGRWLITRSYQLVYLGPGVESYRGRLTSAAVYDPGAQHLRVHLEPEA